MLFAGGQLFLGETDKHESGYPSPLPLQPEFIEMRQKEVEDGFSIYEEIMRAETAPQMSREHRTQVQRFAVQCLSRERILNQARNHVDGQHSLTPYSR
jgi:hypothetical protein